MFLFFPVHSHFSKWVKVSLNKAWRKIYYVLTQPYCRIIPQGKEAYYSIKEVYNYELA